MTNELAEQPGDIGASGQIQPPPPIETRYDRPFGWLPPGFGLISVYTATTFLSALLLFSIQPLFAKMVLPLLGGAPSVWAVALCFFQGALLAGYCWAHILNRFVPARWAGPLHIALCVVAMVVLPIGLPAGWREPPPGDPYLWQIGLFSVAVGLPFVAVAANAPLLQSWFAKTGHPDGRDPYFMYGASNLGSFLALLAYPLVLEPAFGLTALSRHWTIGFVLLGLGLSVCFTLLRSEMIAAGTGEFESSTVATEAADDSMASTEEPSAQARLSWIGLAMVPSALLTAFTTHIATDVASAPLIWVLPLSLYLLTFVLVFRQRPLVFLPCLVVAAGAGYALFQLGLPLFGLQVPDSAKWFEAALLAAAFTWAYWRFRIAPTRWLLAFHLAALILVLLQLSQTRHDTWFVSAATGFAAFFLSALVAHRTLYEARPAASHLTEFYLWMSFGGVLGGLFSALIAPKLFSEVLEYPILLALTMACRPDALKLDLKDRDEWLRLWLIVACGILVVWWSQLFALEDHLREAFYWIGQQTGDTGVGGAFTRVLNRLLGYGMATLLAIAFAVALLAFRRHPPRQLIAALLMCFAVVMLPSSVKRGEAQRSYFGVYRISETYDKDFRVLTHGTTLHGAQRIRDASGTPVVDTTPGTYYHPASPMAKTVELVREHAEAAGREGRFGIVGVGSGSMSCYSKPGESWRFFEIDPVIIGIASGEHAKFSFINTCQPKFDYVLGDARLTLTKEPAESYDLLLVDAFSSDAIPVHLMTAEAIRLYVSKLKPDGVLLLHISNRYLDLESVLASTMPLIDGLDGLLLSDDDADGSYGSTTSTVGVFSKSHEVLEAYRQLDMAHELTDKGLRGWTDDYSDILGPFLSKMKK